MIPAPVQRAFNEVRAGFLILTRIPVGRIGGAVPGMAASAWTWPLVGLVVGGMAAVVHSAALWLGLPLPVAAVLALLTATMATGALHEDGLADLCDGFGGGRDRARRLEIMRDSRIGSYGALALGFSLLIRVMALSSLTGSTGALALVGLAAVSRAPLPAALWLMPPARPDGLGRAAVGVEARRSLLALGLGVGLFALCLPASTWFALPVMALAALALGWLAMERIGGQTGDVLGAMQMVTELAGWLCLSTLIQQ